MWVVWRVAWRGASVATGDMLWFTYCSLPPVAARSSVRTSTNRASSDKLVNAAEKSKTLTSVLNIGRSDEAGYIQCNEFWLIVSGFVTKDDSLRHIYPYRSSIQWVLPAPLWAFLALAVVSCLVFPSAHPEYVPHPRSQILQQMWIFLLQVSIYIATWI